VSKFRGRLRRLERETEGERMTLVCPICGWEATVYGDPAVDLIVLDWKQHQQQTDEHSDFRPDPAVVELFAHEHPAEDFLEKRSGLPLYSREVSGMNLGGPLG
jgi:hypothetical protein